jgi:hypothetical protein
VVDVLIGSVSMAAVLLCVALILGLAFGGLRVGYRKLFEPAPDHMPAVTPFDYSDRQPPAPPR